MAAIPGTGSSGRRRVLSSGAALGTTDGLERLAATDWITYGQELAGYMQSLDRAAVARVDALWFGTPSGPDQATRTEIGRLARAAPTGSPERFEGTIGAILPDRDWPAALRVTAIDAEDGSLRLFDAGSGVALVKAVAASCSVPGVFPPVEIGGRLYIDGGVRSGSGLDLAAGVSGRRRRRPGPRGRPRRATSSWRRRRSSPRPGRASSSSGRPPDPRSYCRPTPSTPGSCRTRSRPAATPAGPRPPRSGAILER